MMGLSKSKVGVMGENGQPDCSMKMVDGGDVGCRSSELLSWLVVLDVLFCFGFFLPFYGFWLTVKVVIFFFFSFYSV